MATDNSNLRRLTLSPEPDAALELRASEERFRELIENVQDVVWSVRFAQDATHSPTTFVSSQAWDTLGHRPEEFIANPNLWSTGVHPDDWPAVESASSQLLAGGPSQTRVYRFRHGRTGEYIWLEDRLAPRRDAAGAVVGLFGVARDITDRKRAERREYHRAGVLERIARNDPIHDLLGDIVSLVEAESDGALCSVLLMDRSGRHLRHGAAPRLPEFYNRAIDGVEIGPNVGSCGTCAYTGRRVIVEDIQQHAYWAPYRELAERARLRSCWSEPILSSTGQVLGTFAIYHEQAQSPSRLELETIGIAANLASIAIERVRSEESLRESEERFRVIFEQAAVGVVQLDVRTNRFVRMNDRYCRILGRSEEDVRVCDFAAITHPDDRDASIRSLARLASGEVREYSLEKRYLRLDGEIRWVNLNVSAMWRPGEPPSLNIGIVEDITDRKKADEDRRRLEDQLRHAQKLESLGVMAGGIAHDFNNLLTGILGYCDLARRELPVGSAANDLIAEAVQGARQAAELTKQMLAYSGKGTFVVEPIVLSNLVEEMARLLQISISKKCILRFDFDRNLPAIEADAAQLRQIVMNLVINASEAIGDRDGTIAVSTAARDCDGATLDGVLADPTLPAGRYVVLEVADTGAGMSTETRAKIFDPFFTTKFTGRGLGLSAVLGIVRGHHGGIQCVSEPGRGTTFRLFFPLSQRSAATPPESPRAADLWRGRGTILVVDDESSILQMSRQMLKTMGFSVLTASDGRSALDVYRDAAEPIDLVLLDRTMPHMDGDETFRELVRLRPDLRVVMTSGYSEQSVAGLVDGPGLAGFLQKPYRFDELRAAVRRALPPDR
jgi:PAS domain S-box-containing protein